MRRDSLARLRYREDSQFLFVQEWRALGLPHLGQGANQSIEDGMALATILAKHDGPDVSSALLKYEWLRYDWKPLADWGLHLIDVNLAIGNFIDVVAEQSRSYLERSRNSAASSK